LKEKSSLEKFAFSRHIFLNGGKMLHAGDTLRQPELAATLKRIAKNGAAEFYSGDTAHVTVDDIQKSGGLITLDDLANLQAASREVLHAQYCRRIATAARIPGTCSRRPRQVRAEFAIIEALNMLQSTQLKGWDDV